MRKRSIVLVLCAFLILAGRAEAQFGVSDPAPGEDFHVELGAMFFKPTPELRIQTGSTIVGEVDFVEEFDIEDKFFTEFRVVAKPARKHKIRFSYMAARWDESATVERTFTFGGRTFTVGAPATADLQWDMYKIGYEWDFVARDRGFVGLIAELKHSDVSANVEAIGIGAVTYETPAPVPTVGIIARGYPHRLVSITGEFSGLKLNTDELEAALWDFDINANVSMGRHFGIQGGYRSVVAEYLDEDDTADLKLQGPYFGAVVRF